MSEVNQENKTVQSRKENVNQILQDGMKTNRLRENLPALTKEMSWLSKILDFRINTFFKEESKYETFDQIHCPDLTDYKSPYTDFVHQSKLTEKDRLLILLALAPHVCPEVLDILIINNNKTGQMYTQFGGVRGGTHRGLLPTLATAAFVIGGSNMEDRFVMYQLLEENNFLLENQIISLEKEHPNDPDSASLIKIGAEYLNKFTLGGPYKPKFGPEFPAQQLTTRLNWDDLVLEFESKNKIQDILNWMTHKHVILEDWEMDKVFKKGYRSLFYGPPGTGKTLTAALLGQKTGKEVFRIDISRVVSKYIGETEKNLGKIFDIAEHKDWILFFDEADALFGKRTQTSDAKDRYANQEVAYLLQRIEDYSGIVLLSTNLRSNIDPAFMRRFQSLVHFPIPSAPRRYELWQRSIGKAPFDKTINFKNIAKRYEISGGMIINVIRACCLVAVTHKTPTITEDDIVEEIKAEFRKEGKTV